MSCCTVSSETSHIAEPDYYSLANIWGWIRTDLTQIPLSSFCFQSKSHKSVSMAVVYPLARMRFFSLVPIMPWMSGFLSLPPPLFFLSSLRSCSFFLAGVWAGRGREKEKRRVDIVSLLESVQQSRLLCWLPFLVTFKW